MASLKEAFLEHATASEGQGYNPIWVDPTGQGREVGDSQYINTNNTRVRRNDVIGDPSISNLRPLQGSDQNIRGFHNNQGPSIFDTRYDNSYNTWFYRQRPRLYNEMSQYYSNPQLFGFPNWWENFQNPNSNNIYLALIIILVIICFFMRKK
tara:strand:+ start:1170 stop:1625 length:456 start_codon:yes stop_codon:yes gene_type:complete